MNYKIAISTLRLEEKIPADDPVWPRFNASFVNRELSLIEIANEIYGGHAFTTWHKDHWRITENYQLGQHIGLDFDTKDECSTLAYLKQDKFIARHAALIYTTPSHTTEAPKARVVFALDAPIHQSQNYILAARTLLWLFGKADAKCKDAARFFYGSVRCDVEYLDNVLPLSKIKELIQKYKETGERTRRTTQPTGNVDADKLTDSIIAKAADGERNALGFWLACKLAEGGFSRDEAERQLRRYQQHATRVGRTPYSEHEALASIASAYRKIGIAGKEN